MEQDSHLLVSVDKSVVRYLVSGTARTQACRLWSDWSSGSLEAYSFEVCYIAKDNSK